jgi:Zn/Cd-binding protein ZinT
MPNFIPTAQEQLKFLKNIQLILQSGSFSSTYKFALLISLSRLAIERGEDSGERLTLEYIDIAEKFIELYWNQAVPYTFHEEGQLILNQNNGNQAAIVNWIVELRQNYSSLGLLRRDSAVWLGELGQFYIDFEKCGRVQISESDFKKYELKNGDLVLARAIGSKNQLGKCSYFSEYFEPVCIDSHVMRLRPDSEKMHPLWFYFLLSSDQGKKILQSKSGATAVQFNINSAKANDLDIALPPLSEQAKFVEIANKILKNKDSHIKSLEKNNLLFSSLQNQAFNGTL